MFVKYGQNTVNGQKCGETHNTYIHIFSRLLKLVVLCFNESFKVCSKLMKTGNRRDAAAYLTLELLSFSTFAQIARWAVYTGEQYIQVSRDNFKSTWREVTFLKVMNRLSSLNYINGLPCQNVFISLGQEKHANVNWANFNWRPFFSEIIILCILKKIHWKINFE